MTRCRSMQTSGAYIAPIIILSAAIGSNPRALYHIAPLDHLRGPAECLTRDRRILANVFQF